MNHDLFGQTVPMSAAEDWLAPDPERVLSLEEVAEISRRAGAVAYLTHPSHSTGIEDENGEYISTHGNGGTMEHPIPSQRCEHRSEHTGRRCKKWARTGLRHCEFHDQFGEATLLLRDYVLDYARRDLYRLTPMALGVIEEIMTDEDVNPAVRLKAATETLDRVGVRGGSEVTVNVDAVVSDPAAEIRARLERLASIAGSGAPALPQNDIVDAEIVEGI